MIHLSILYSPVSCPRILTSAECANLRAEEFSCSPAWLVFPIVSESDGGGQLYSPSRRGCHVDAEIRALQVKS